MTQLESKIKTLKHPDKNIFDFLSDFRNFNHLIPKDKIKDWQANKNTCSFSMSPAGYTNLEIIDKEEYKTIKIKGNSIVSFFFWIQLKQIAPNDTKAKLTIRAELNSFIRTMAKPVLHKFLDDLANQMKYYFDYQYKNN